MAKKRKSTKKVPSKSKPAAKRPASSPSTPRSKSRPMTPKAAKLVEILPSPKTSNVDKNAYRMIKLPNGITALLIHENGPPSYSSISEDGDSFRGGMFCSPPELGGSSGASKPCGERNGNAKEGHGEVSFALTVNAGASLDPKTCFGLAHFCEHMVHYGSEKYKGEETYSQHIAVNGYIYNAFTQAMTTTYHFSVKKECLNQTLDIFSNMMYKPLFEFDLIVRESQAVDNEFILKEWMDMHAHIMIVSKTSKNEHPLNKFGCGTAKTLVGKGVKKCREELINYHKTHYVGSAMTLAVQSTHSLDQLQKMITDNFNIIPEGVQNIRRDIRIPNEHMDPYDTPAFNKLYVISGKQSTHVMRVTWALPPESWMETKAKSLDFLEVLMDVENGLEQSLRQEGLVTHVYAGSPECELYRNEYSALFEISVGLNEIQGKQKTLVQKVESILQPIFQFFDKLKQTSIQQRVDLWAELCHTRNAYFNHQQATPTPSSSLAQDSSIALQVLSPEEIFTAKTCLKEEDYEDNKVMNLLGLLTPQRMNVTLCIPQQFLEENHTNELGSMTECKEEFTEVKYWRKDFPRSIINLKSSAPLSCDIKFENEFSRLVKSSVQSMPRQSSERIHWNEKCLVEHFGHPGPHVVKGTCRVTLIPGEIGNNPRSVMKLGILEVYWHTIAIAQLESKIRRSGMDVTIRRRNDFVYLTLTGFQEKLPLALKSLLTPLFKASSISNENFELCRSTLLKDMHDNLGVGNSLTWNLFHEMVFEDEEPFINLPHILKSITFQEFQRFCILYTNLTFALVGVFGNVNPQTCQEIAQAINGIKFFPKIPGWRERLEKASNILNLPLTEKCIRVKSSNMMERNSYVTNCYQAFGERGRTRNVRAIIEYLGFVMASPAFQTLRTQQQLGYTVGLFPLLDPLMAPMILVHVIFPFFKHSACEVDRRIDRFILDFYTNHLSKVTQKQFAEAVSFIGLPITLTLTDVQAWYKDTFLVQIKPIGETLDAVWNDWGPLRKFSLQVLGRGCEADDCLIPRCRAVWVKPKGHDQPISFGAERSPSDKEYFLSNIPEYKKNYDL